MAVIRDPANSENTVPYIGTLAFFCGISCIILMLRFRGFKASLNFKSGSRKSTEYYEDVPAVSMKGAYRANREEFFGYGSFSEPPKEKITPSMVKLPPSNLPNPTVRPSKSTSNLTQPTNVPQPTNVSQNLRNSTPNISSDPRGVPNNNQTPIRKTESRDVKKQEKEQKKLEKKRLEEQKKRDKLAAQEQAKQDKLKKEREKIEKQKVAKDAKGKKGKKATPKPQPRANPLAQGSSLYPTNTLDSSISKTSGPPPYTEAPKPEVVQNQNDNTGNTSFGKPVDNSASSWDMVSQHRQQISRPVAAKGGKPKQMVMDLQYSPGRPSGSSNSKGNSEA